MEIKLPDLIPEEQVTEVYYPEHAEEEIFEIYPWLRDSKEKTED